MEKGHPLGEGVPLHRSDKNQNRSDTCKDIKGFLKEEEAVLVPEVNDRGWNWRTAVSSGGTSTTPTQWSGILR